MQQDHANDQTECYISVDGEDEFGRAPGKPAGYGRETLHQIMD